MQKPCQHGKIPFLNLTKIYFRIKINTKQSYTHKRSTVYLMSIEKKIKYKKIKYKKIYVFY